MRFIFIFFKSGTTILGKVQIGKVQKNLVGFLKPARFNIAKIILLADSILKHF